jgi:hypothetical protein
MPQLRPLLGDQITAFAVTPRNVAIAPRLPCPVVHTDKRVSQRLGNGLPLVCVRAAHAAGDSTGPRLIAIEAACKTPPSNPRRSASRRPAGPTDELTQFLQLTHQQQYATFHQKKEAVSRLIAINDLFVRVSKDWLNPKQKWRCRRRSRRSLTSRPLKK